MKKNITLAAMLCLIASSMQAQALKTRKVDEGGTGKYKAIAIKEKSLPDFVVYRPENLKAAKSQAGAMPILMWANGGCSDTSVGYERMLTEIASHGYIIVAIGEMQDKLGDRKESHTQSSEIKRGLDWLIKQNFTKKSDYYMTADTSKIAAAGHSCGGAQVLCNAADPRLKTYLIMNAGMGDMEMAGASKESLPNVHGPILYVVGGQSDVAYQNAQKDYDRISHAPIALADHPASGHGGTYNHPNGGDYGRLVTDWLDWHLKGKEQNAEIFTEGKLANYKGWTMKSKNFKNQNTSELWIENGNHKIFGILSKPKQSTGKQPVAIISHGFNGTHHFGMNYFKTFNDMGFQCYSFDFTYGSINSRSDNNTMKMSILQEQSDLEAIVRHFRSQPDVDPTRIVLIGESQGGLVSALTAASMPNEISELILIYPALCIPQNWTDRYPRIEDIPDTTRLWNVPMGRNFFTEIRDLDVFKVIGKFKKPVIIIQGDADRVVSMEDSRRAIELYKDARLHVIPGAGHGFKPHEFKESIGEIEKFLKK